MMRGRSAPMMAGASLAEMMVGLAVGMVVMVVVLQLGVLFDARRKSVSGMAEAGIDGSLAVSSLTRELRMAGSGLGPPDALRCELTKAEGLALGSGFPLWPVVISNGTDGEPDTIELLASGKAQLLPAARLILAYAQGDPSISVDSTFGVAPNDWLMLQQSGTARCLLVRASAIPVGGFRIEPAVLPSGAVPAGGYAIGSALVNLGTLQRLRFSVGPDASLRQAQFDIESERWSVNPLAGGVVNLQAQYGFDARPGAQAAPTVSWWSDGLIDADGNGSTGNADDWRRLLAVRIAVVLRSTQRKEGACDTHAPSWYAGRAKDGQLEPTLLHIGKAADADCFRYRVIEAEVPLRNLLWSDA